MAPPSLLILAPQGWEHQAIAKGLGHPLPPGLALESIPAGLGIAAYLPRLAQTWTASTRPQALLVMGFAGSLVNAYGLGQAVWITQTIPWPGSHPPQCCDLALIDHLDNILGPYPRVKGVTTEEVITQAQNKQDLAAHTGAQMVEMENWPLLTFAQAQGMPMAILRVVSDGPDQDLPDLQGIYTPTGQLNPRILARRFARRPLAALRLIRGAFIARRTLHRLAQGLGGYPTFPQGPQSLKIS